jgi:hypothetical protein
MRGAPELNIQVTLIICEELLAEYTGNSDNMRGAPAPNRDIFIFGVNKESTIDTVK